jgi:hypothetical protein
MPIFHSPLCSMAAFTHSGVPSSFLEVETQFIQTVAFPLAAPSPPSPHPADHAVLITQRASWMHLPSISECLGLWPAIKHPHNEGVTSLERKSASRRSLSSPPAVLQSASTVTQTYFQCSEGDQELAKASGWPFQDCVAHIADLPTAPAGKSLMQRSKFRRLSAPSLPRYATPPTPVEAVDMSLE